MNMCVTLGLNGLFLQRRQSAFEVGSASTLQLLGALLWHSLYAKVIVNQEVEFTFCMFCATSHRP